MAYNEVIIKQFTNLGTDNKVLHVRIVKTNGKDSQLDIREHVTSPEFTGYTKKGVRLNWSDVQTLERILPEIIEIMDKE